MTPEAGLRWRPALVALPLALGRGALPSPRWAASSSPPPEHERIQRSWEPSPAERPDVHDVRVSLPGRRMDRPGRRVAACGDEHAAAPLRPLRFLMEDAGVDSRIISLDHGPR